MWSKEEKEEIAKLFTKTKLSRLLVYEENIDQIKGILHLKDVLRYQRDNDVPDVPIGTLQELLREPEFIPLTKNIHDLFQEMYALGHIVDGMSLGFRFRSDGQYPF